MASRTKEDIIKEKKPAAPIFWNYKEYQYYIDGLPEYEVFNKQGKSIIKETLWVFNEVHDKIRNIIDEYDSKQIKRHISLVEDGDNNFDVWAEDIYLGKVKKSGFDSYMCFPTNSRYTAYNAKDLHSMMEYFRGVEAEIKGDK